MGGPLPDGRQADALGRASDATGPRPISVTRERPEPRPPAASSAGSDRRAGTIALVGGFPGREDALAFAILVQAVWYVPTTVVGGAFVVMRFFGRTRVVGAARARSQSSSA